MSVLTDAQEKDIIEAFEDSDDMKWCSGAVRWPSATLPLFYKTRREHDTTPGKSSEPEVK